MTTKTTTKKPPTTKAPAMNVATILPKAITDGLDPLMHRILSTPRGHNGNSEIAFGKWLRDQIVALGGEWVQREADQTVVTIPGAKKNVMFACHVDTVDNPSTTGTKTIEYDPDFQRVTLAQDSIGECLGADDGAGVWMLLKMIEAKVPGTYVFHRGEERGCIGAHAFIKDSSPWLQKFDMAVEFDRPGDTEVITHQGGQRCASNTFAEALCKALEPEVVLDPSTRGVLTDVKYYRGLIPECVNIGVGYRGHHGVEEELDMGYLERLLAAVIQVDWDELPIQRDPTAVEPYSSPFPTKAPAQGALWGYTPPKAKAPVPPPPEKFKSVFVEDEYDGCSLDDLMSMCETYDPDEMAREVAQLLVRIDSLKAENKTLRGLLGF